MQERSAMDKLKLIKILVAILTFLIVFGMLSAVGIIYKKTRAPQITSAALSLSQPQGSTVENIQIAEQTLYILVKNGGRSDRIIIINPDYPQKQTVININ